MVWPSSQDAYHHGARGVASTREVHADAIVHRARARLARGQMSPSSSLQYLPESSFTPSKSLLPLHDRSTGFCRNKTLRLAALLAVWYSTSLLTSLSTKAILRDFPYPISLAAVQQAIAAADVLQQRAQAASKVAASHAQAIAATIKTRMGL